MQWIQQQYFSLESLVVGYGAHVTHRVCRGLDIDGFVYRGNVAHVPFSRSIDGVVFPKWVFIFMGFPICGSPCLSTIVGCILFIIWGFSCPLDIGVWSFLYLFVL